MKMYFKPIVLFLAALLSLVACNNDAKKTQLFPFGTGKTDSSKSIENFYFTSPLAMGAINETDHTISVIVPHGTDVTALEPTIIHTGESVGPASGAARNFSGPVTYTVTAADTSAQDYIVTVTVAAGTAPSISAFFFMSPLAMGVVNETDHTVAVTVPHGTDITTLAPTIIHTGASVSPSSGMQRNFSGPVTYTVTAADTSTQDYTVTVTVAAGVPPALSAFYFTIPAAIGTINDTNHTVAVTVPYGTDVTALTPTVIHNGASVSPSSGAARNFTSPVTYRVTAADTSTQDYTVTVTVAANSPKEITSFGFASLSATGVISGTSISVNVPVGTDVTSLVATFSITGAFVKVVETGLVQASGYSPNDFTSSRTYRVTATDGTTRDYTVKVGAFPSVTTTPIAGNLSFTLSIKGTTAKGGGTVTEQGSSAVTERGLCWNTTGSPTTSDSKASDGSGTGTYTNVSMTGLTVNTLYHVRAYAINDMGTAYGNEITFNSGYAFGTDHAGGYVFFNNGSGSGLVSAKSDQSIYQVWSNITDTMIGTTGTAVGAGQANTTAIISQSGHTESAAKLCDDYTDGTYNDWFLPSKDELILMYQNLRLIGVGGFTHTCYWSSSEYNAVWSWWVDPYYGDLYYYFKECPYYVRAVRAF